MYPVLVTPPAGEIVSLEDIKVQLKVAEDTSRDSEIEAYIVQAVAHLDGYGGILGRCILSQQWAVTYDRAGTYKLPLPDVVEVVAVDADDIPVDVTLQNGRVSIADAATVTMTCALPERLLPVVVSIVTHLVKRDFDALKGPELEANKDAVGRMLGGIRATRI